MMNALSFRSRLVAILLGVSQLIDLSGQAQRRSRPDPEPDREPQWEIVPQFRQDVFTFVRIRYTSYGGYSPFGDRWSIDYPDAELNLCYRLQQLTSMKVAPRGEVLEIMDPALTDYPFIYIVEPGQLYFTDSEVSRLRGYLLNGGFLMVDDFWGERQWASFNQELRRVFPEREAVELPIEHPIFHCVFDLNEKPQVPNVGLGRDSQYHGITWEKPDARTPHYKGVFDDQGRLMVFICHNTDLGDGWEQEGRDEYYFREFSEKKAYPLGINIIFYAMTH